MRVPASEAEKFYTVSLSRHAVSGVMLVNDRSTVSPNNNPRVYISPPAAHDRLLRLPSQQSLIQFQSIVLPSKPEPFIIDIPILKLSATQQSCAMWSPGIALFAGKLLPSTPSRALNPGRNLVGGPRRRGRGQSVCLVGRQSESED